jgi:thiol-disulfide isomerase/thioredoxin
MSQPAPVFAVTRRAVLAAGVGLAMAPQAFAQAPRPFRPGPPWAAPRTNAALPLDLPLRGLDGETTLGAVMNARPAVVNLWATWCGPCVMEKPALNQLARQEAGRGDRVAIVSIVAFDDAVRDGETLRRAYGRFNAPALTPLRATPAAEAILVRHFGESSRQRRRTSLPATSLLDPGGRELGRILGAAVMGSGQRLYWTDPSAARMFDRLVSPPA